MKQDKIMEALTGIDDDLLALAQKQFSVHPWKRWAPTAACLALVLCLTAVALPYFPMGCGSSMAPSSETAETAPAEVETPGAAPEDAVMETPTEEQEPAAVEDRVEFEGMVQVEVCGAVYRLCEQEPLEDAPDDLGAYLADVTGSGEDSLMGCPAYAVLEESSASGSAESAPARIYVQSPDGWLLLELLHEEAGD